MTKITTDFEGTETLAVTKTRLESILTHYLGAAGTTALTNWGIARARLNSIAPSVVSIADGEKAAVFRSKLNTLNSPGTVPSLGHYRSPDGALPSLVLDYSGAIPLYGLDTGTVSVGDPDDFLTCTRASSALVRSASGVYSSVGNNVLRRSFENGSFCLLAEETRANATINSSMAGAVVGSIFPSTGGVAPTGWNVSTVAGSTWEIVAAGTENGLPYIDVRYTATDGTGGGAMNFDTTPSLPAAEDGQTWATSAFIRRVAGSVTNLGAIHLRSRWVGDTGSYQSGADIRATIDSTDRRVNVHTVADDTGGSGTIDSVQIRLSVGATSGGASDITFRISAPQLEQGAFATSPIITSGTAVTRNSDQIKLNDGLLAQIYGGGPISVLAEFEMVYNTAGSGNPRVWQMDMGDSDNLLALSTQESAGDSRVVSRAAATSGFASNVAYTSGALLRAAARFQSGAFAVSRNGGTVVTSTATTLPPGLVNLGIGNAGFNTSSGAAGLLRLRKLIVYPHALTNAELEALSA